MERERREMEERIRREYEEKARREYEARLQAEVRLLRDITVFRVSSSSLVSKLVLL